MQKMVQASEVKLRHEAPLDLMHVFHFVSRFQLSSSAGQVVGRRWILGRFGAPKCWQPFHAPGLAGCRRPWLQVIYVSRWYAFSCLSVMQAAHRIFPPEGSSILNCLSCSL